MHGTTCWFEGDFAGARVHLERALATFDPQRHGDLAFRFGQDVGVSAMTYLAPALWSVGEITRAQELEDAMIVRAREIGHVATGRRWFDWACARRGLDPVATYRDLVRRHYGGVLKPPFNHAARGAAGFEAAFYEGM